MSSFDEISAELDQGAVAPPRVVSLPLSAWKSTYSGRPERDVKIGLRLPGQDDTDTVETEALKALQHAAKNGDEAAVRAYNESKLLNIVALCICDPFDVNKAHDLFETPNAILEIALTPQGIRRLFDEIERLQIETSPIFREASDEELNTFALMINEGAVQGLDSKVDRARIRRYVAYCIEMLTNG